MRKPECAFPDGTSEFLVDDTLFARAYQETPDHCRALLKTCIARLYEWYGPSRTSGGLTEASWRSGFDSIRCHAPVDYCLVLFDETLRSPSRLLAGVVPAMACGVDHLLAVRVGASGEWEQPILTGLELAGQELAADMDAAAVTRLLDDLDDSGCTGAVVDLTADGGLRPERSGPAWYRPTPVSSTNVWMEEGDLFDLEALAFAQPDLDFTVHGCVGDLPQGSFLCGTNDLEHVLANLTNVAYLPASLAKAGLDRAELVLGPGQEGCWAWPGLTPEFFQIHRIAWTIGA